MPLPEITSYQAAVAADHRAFQARITAVAQQFSDADHYRMAVNVQRVAIAKEIARMVELIVSTTIFTQATPAIDDARIVEVRTEAITEVLELAGLA